MFLFVEYIVEEEEWDRRFELLQPTKYFGQILLETL